MELESDDLRKLISVYATEIARDTETEPGFVIVEKAGRLLEIAKELVKFTVAA